MKPFIKKFLLHRRVHLHFCAILTKVNTFSDVLLPSLVEKALTFIYLHSKMGLLLEERISL